MKAKIEELCSDPLFQLNLSIWLAQPTPRDFSIRPILYQSGFKIFSIGPLLALPPDIRLITIESKIDCQGSAKPELILESENGSKLLMIECKRSSFGSSSSTASQTRTLLLLSGPKISEVLAIGARSSGGGILCYLTRSDQVASLGDTLAELTEELRSLRLDTGDHGCLGIKSTDTAILLEYSDQIRTLLNFQDTSPTEILKLEEEADPRPLYFIPYDPNVDQSAEEQTLARRTLYERFLGCILSKVGPANAPCEVTISQEEILMSTTFGIYEIWEDREARKHLRKLLRVFMDSLRNSLGDERQKFVKYQKEKGWVFEFEDQNVYREISTQISKFKPEKMELSRPIETTQLELFEE
jgi:hypothetical protein